MLDYLSELQLSRLPRAYREESRIVEETRFSIELLRTMLSLIWPNHRPIYESEALATEVLSSVWEESEASAFFALDCQELRTAIKILNEPVVQRRDAFTPTPSGAPRAAIHVIHAAYPILRGHIELIETVPLTSVEHDPLAMQLLITLDDKNKLVRDNHHVGWHYHYCDAKGKRSDTMLSFDTNQPDRLDKGVIKNVPLFWERHSEGKAKFRAKAHLWGDPKRESIWTSAFPEVEKHPLDEFRRPKDEASPVWPLNAILSPRPYS